MASRRPRSRAAPERAPREGSPIETREPASLRDDRPRLRAIRGAISVDRDDPGAIYEATRALLSAIVARNAVATDDIISVIFTVTPDLRSAFPALAARQMGWLDVPLLCTMEIPVPGALGQCIRVLLHVETTRSRSEMEHVYLGGAEALRPDQARS
jgi:chorismate mutase